MIFAKWPHLKSTSITYCCEMFPSKRMHYLFKRKNTNIGFCNKFPFSRVMRTFNIFSFVCFQQDPLQKEESINFAKQAKHRDDDI